MKNYNAVFTLLAFLLPIICYSQDSLLVSIFKENTYNLKVDNQKLSGSSLPILQKAIKESQFLMVGEQHGIREVADFTTALSKKAFAEGFEFLCIETDPSVAEQLEKLSIEEIENAKSFFQTYPLAVPFYTAKEEFDLIRAFKSRKRNTKESIWGIDQVFMATPRYTFEILSNETSNDEGSAIISGYAETAKSQFNSFMESQNPTELPMMKLQDSDFEQLYALFNKDSDKKAQQLISGLQSSQEIYKHFMMGEGYWNNYKRSQLMKRQFMDYYNRHNQNNKLPKVILKLGSFHTSKGLTPMFIYDVGNMVSELAATNNLSASNFKITGLKGESFGFGGAINSFDNAQELTPEVTKIVEENGDNNQWIFIDLKSIRSKLSFEQLGEMKDLIFAYDYWIIIPEANPSSKL